MKQSVVHIVGAGVAGLAAARTLAATGARAVVMHEARAQAGGRRRSFYDETLGLNVDTGNFPLLSCWSSALSLVEAIGARGEWREESEPGVAFADFSSGERWRLRPNPGRAPWWLIDPGRRGPRLKLSDYWAARRLCSASKTATVAESRAEQRSGNGSAVATFVYRRPQLSAGNSLGDPGGGSVA